MVIEKKELPKKLFKIKYFGKIDKNVGQ